MRLVNAETILETDVEYSPGESACCDSTTAFFVFVFVVLFKFDWLIICSGILCDQKHNYVCCIAPWARILKLLSIPNRRNLHKVAKGTSAFRAAAWGSDSVWCIYTTYDLTAPKNRSTTRVFLEKIIVIVFLEGQRLLFSSILNTTTFCSCWWPHPKHASVTPLSNWFRENPDTWVNQQMSSETEWARLVLQLLIDMTLKHLIYLQNRVVQKLTTETDTTWPQTQRLC